MNTIINQIPNRESFDKGRDTLEIGYPWLTFGAIIALEAIINKEMRVLEFGSGGSTLFWAKNCKSVKSYETNPKWFADVKQKTDILNNVELILSTEHLSFGLKTEPDNFYDVVLIDSDPKYASRLRLAKMSVPKIKVGGWLVIDNYLKWNLDDFDFSNWEVYSFDEFHYVGKGTRLCKKLI